MKAYELKSLADKANQDKEDPQIEAGYQRISHDLKDIALLGRYTYTYDLSYLNVSAKVWYKIGERLRLDGFKVEFDHEVTAWYSNTDYDQTEVVRISWV